MGLCVTKLDSQCFSAATGSWTRDFRRDFSLSLVESWIHSGYPIDGRVVGFDLF
jgi:hypothetical protein